jgi:hypothetical protein
MMGFNSEVVEFAAIKVDYRDIEDVIEYLTGKDEIDGLYNHDYFEAQDDLCFLCHESLSLHRKKKLTRVSIEEDMDYNGDLDEGDIDM